MKYLTFALTKGRLASKTLEMLEDIWDEYQVYSGDELNMVGDTVKMND